MGCEIGRVGTVKSAALPFRIDEERKCDMKNILEKLERLFAAVCYAEAGEHGTAREVMEQKGRIAEVRNLGVHRGAAAPLSRSTRRAA